MAMPPKNVFMVRMIYSIILALVLCDTGLLIQKVTQNNMEEVEVMEE